MSILTKSRIEEIKEASLFFEDESRKRGNGHFSLLAGISSSFSDTFPETMYEVNQRTQPIIQQIRVAGHGFPENEFLPFSEPAGLTSFHSWLSWAVLQNPHKYSLAFSRQGSQKKRRFPNAWSN